MEPVKNAYLKQASLIAVLLLFLSASATAQQSVQSDYEIVESYQSGYKSLHEQVDHASSSEQVDSLITVIKQFDRNFKEHKELLNQVIHPEDYTSRLKDLQKNALTAQNQLLIIEQQADRIQRMNQKLAGYDRQLDQLNGKTDSLQLAMQKSIKSEKQLSAMVRKYRKSLEDRDDLILSFVDSVMFAYQNLSSGSTQNFEITHEKARFEANGNALNMIKSIAQENIDLLSSNPKLSTEEYLRMNAVQRQFDDMWEKVGDKLVDIYAGNNPGRENKEVNASIDIWEKKISSKTWTALNETMHKKGIDLPKFTSSRTFYNSLNSYLENAFELSRGERSQKTYANYLRFYSFWTNEVQMNWSPYMEKGDILSARQLAAIDRKIDQWASIAEPESNILMYLFGGSVLAIVVLGIVLIREKAK